MQPALSVPERIRDVRHATAQAQLIIHPAHAGRRTFFAAANQDGIAGRAGAQGLDPRFNGPGKAAVFRQLLIDNQRAAAAESHGAGDFRVPGIQGIVSGGDFLAVVHSVVIGIRASGVRPQLLLFAVAQAVTVRVQIEIPNIIAERVGIKRIGSCQIFVVVGQSVSVRITVRAVISGSGIGVQTYGNFPPIRHPVAIAVNELLNRFLFIKDRVNQSSGMTPGRSAIPVTTLGEVFGADTAIVESQVQNRASAGAHNLGQTELPAGDNLVLQGIRFIHCPQNLGAQIAHLQRRVLRQRQRRAAGHKRSRHGGAVITRIGITRRGAEDAGARSGQVHGQIPVVREVRQIPVALQSRDGNDVRQIIIRRIVVIQTTGVIIVPPVIAGGRDDQMAVVSGEFDGVI